MNSTEVKKIVLKLDPSNCVMCLKRPTAFDKRTVTIPMCAFHRGIVNLYAKYGVTKK